MPPCQCGFLGDNARVCRCSPDQIRRYQERLSGPFLDRIDIRLQVSRTEVRLGADGEGETSAVVAGRVQAARERQLARAGVMNARLNSAETRRWCMPAPDGRQVLEQAAEKFRLSRRACDSVLRVARTIADLALAATVTKIHVAEALHLRLEFLR